MAFWIELHCDIARADLDCPSTRGDQPAAFALNTTSSVAVTAKQIAERAKRLGYQRVGKQWVCSRCIATLPAQHTARR